MPCYHLISCYRSRNGNISFQQVPDSDLIRIACGRCIGCRLERSRVWAQRLVDESRFHDETSFITLTYADECLPPGGSLYPRHFELFMKKLRKRLHPKRVRFFHAGEYGEKRGRPHYHAIIFGEDFINGRYDLEESDLGDLTWTSPLLEHLWEHGDSRVGAVSFESCAYVARYVCKKVTGQRAEDVYWKYDPRSGECFDLEPEYATQSRKPGIGFLHAVGYAKELLARDSVISRGRECPLPRYYDKVLEKFHPECFEEVKLDRLVELSRSGNRSPDRLKVREAVKNAQIGNLRRRYEIG